MIRYTLFAVMVVVFLSYVSGQADLANSYTPDKQPLNETALFVADALYKHPVLFRKLLKISAAAQPLLKLGGNDPKSGMFMNFVLDMVPGLLQSPETAGILEILADELHRVNITDVYGFLQAHNMTQDNPQAKQMVSGAILKRIDKLRTVRRILTGNSARHFLPMTSNDTITDVCYNDMMNFMDAMISAQIPPRDALNYTFIPWALNMFDAFGKPTGGITKGSLYWVGSYDLCVSIKAGLPAGVILGNRTLTTPIKFNGKFCRAQFRLPDALIKSFNVDTRGVALSLSWGICVPDSCHSNDIAQMFDLGVMKGRGIVPHTVTCFEERDLTKDTSGLVAAIILLVFVAVVVCSTLVDGVGDWIKDNIKTDNAESDNSYELSKINGNVNGGYVADPDEGSSQNVMEIKSAGELPPAYTPHKNDKGELGEEYLNGGARKFKDVAEVKITKPSRAQAKPRQSVCQQLIKAFSLYTNIPKILNGTKNPNAIHCLHGIRFFSIMWIILGHTYNYGILSVQDNPTTENLLDADKLFKRFSFQGIQAAGFAVDTFFFLSGLLICFLTLKDVKKRPVNCGYAGMFYFHRYWRLTPVYMIVMMTFSCLYRYLGEGPLWPAELAAADNCKQVWWTNLLYVNNLVHVDDQCMGWSWYLADDMQFYIISPFFIFLLHRIPVVGILATVMMMCAGVASSFAKEYKFGGDMFRMKENPHYWADVYIVPWTRVAAYCVGILLGYIMFKSKKGSLSNTKALIGWILTFAVGLTLCYVTYDYRAEGKDPWPRWGTSIYESFGRPLWAMCVAWIVYACHNGKGGIINNILSFSGLIPLSRLTYAAYLLHPVMMIIYVFGKKSLIYISDYDIAYLYMGHVVCTYLAAFFFSSIFEAPFLTLEKILFRRGGHSS
ncbi:nose resistant to fluoxetine protein 6-like [Haliotis rufescens]|uniref:nose resistant to fluoxetine protein 6-like n=1 Tax=Haliotis rufescens TaxID=6454 RepID=UPI00201EDCF2|nr:nose resistant to fluoxetine protein 6-like [Haliotis rufescens]